MASETLIRPATLDDVPVLGRLGALMVTTHHAFDPKRFIAAAPYTEEGYGSFLGQQLDEPNIVVLVAISENEVIGYT